MSRAEQRREARAQAKTVTVTQARLDQMLADAKADGEAAGTWKALQLFLGLTVLLVHDHIGQLTRKSWGGKTREQRAYDMCVDYYEGLQNGEYDFVDLMTVLKQECGVDLITGWKV